MDEFTQYLGDSCIGLTSLENIEPTIASLDRVTAVERVTVAPWEYGSEPWTMVEPLRDQENAAPGKKGKRRSAECEKSMYAVFFKQQQPIIKSLNPSASFGQISRLIAAAWERVGEEQKKNFKVAAAAAKREEMRKRIALKTIQLCGGQH
ncbi:hmg-6 [Pristionchus pacificus]|uniref:HMG box domain-containing protein n=1 Tax=Pristionchus pacificus TaxID=54126 RepID=A0A8R1V598_PRIPA|nr:hmg-6 [Pristionchus pacificus]